MAKLTAVAALVALTSEAARVRRREDEAGPKPKLVAGVPVHNYDLRFVQDEELRRQGSAADLDWVVMFRADATQQDLEKFCGGPAKVGSCRVMGHADRGLPFATAKVSEDKLAQMLKAHSGAVEFVEPDLPVYVIPEVPEVPEAASSGEELWGHGTIKLEQATFTGAGVHIYVMDTGVRTSHQDFGGRAIPTLDTIVGDGEAVECNGDPTCAGDTDGHGTHCAGTAGGTAYGAAKESIIHAMKVCCGPGTNVLAGMDWVGMMGGRPAIMTMSLGSWGTSESDKVAMDMLVDAGVTVFVSAGNNNDVACLKTFSFIDSAITIGSTTSANERSSFSNFGSCVNLWAPGSRIVSASHLDDVSSTIKSGTSMATPLAAGVGAMLLQEFPSYTPAQLLEVMIQRTQKDVLSRLKDDDSNFLLSAI
jgi:subtilisin family serine protease